MGRCDTTSRIFPSIFILIIWSKTILTLSIQTMRTSCALSDLPYCFTACNKGQLMTTVLPASCPGKLFYCELMPTDALGHTDEVLTDETTQSLMPTRRKWNETCFRPRFCIVRLYWTGDNLGSWDEFFHASYPLCKIIAQPVGLAVQHAATYYGWPYRCEGENFIRHRILHPLSCMANIILFD